MNVGDINAETLALGVAVINSGVLVRLAQYFLRIERRIMALEVRIEAHMHAEESRHHAP